MCIVVCNYVSACRCLLKGRSLSPYCCVLVCAYFSLPTVADSPQQMVTRPVWVPDAVAKECMVCQTRFSTFVRKHHCRRCGRVVCSACSPHHVSLTAADSALLGHAPSEHSKLERVCKECFKEMTAQHNRCKLLRLRFI